MTQIIGIDCATDLRKVGVAFGEFREGHLSIQSVRTGNGTPPIIDVITEAINISERTLLALDAPLGWPDAMSRLLPHHQAGGRLEVASNNMFRRETDRFVKDQLGKTPLDVGADRIARTAHAALNLLWDISHHIGSEIPLAWEPGFNSNVCAIEVYPAATLIAYQPTVKSTPDAKVQLIHEVLDSAPPENMETTLDTIDACLCVIAGADFLRGTVVSPEKLELAKKEGWIWFKNG